MITKNQRYTVTIENTTIEGFGVCRIDGRAVFVQGALEGEQWDILILKVSAAAVWAKGLQCLSAARDRLDNDCPNPCGGCALRQAEYSAELNIKQQHVKDCLNRIGNLGVEAVPIHPSPSVRRYRNKAIFAVGLSNGRAVFGFYRPRSHDIIPITDCLLQSERCIRAAKAVTDYLNREHILPYDEATGKGTLRHIFYRESRCGDAVLCLISARGFGNRTEELVNCLRETCNELTGIVLNINKTTGNTVLSGDFYTLWGEPTVRETFCGYTFRFSPQAFLQVNPSQAEMIYRKAVTFASGIEKTIESETNCASNKEAEPCSNNKLALELYCGAGTVSLCLATAFNRVIAAEIVPEAVENARLNAEYNGVETIEFRCADAGGIADQLSAEGIRPNVVLVDPPRKGLTGQVIYDISRMQPERVVYISCNPATLARDLRVFTDLGYELKYAEAFDMFPRTAHVETVVLMSRKDT